MLAGRLLTVILLLPIALATASPSAGQERSTVEWTKAADALGLRVWSIALREKAFRSYRGSDAAAAALAGKWIQQQLELGLTADAIATFKNLPRAVRTRLEERPSGAEISEVPDLRLELAAAYLPEGDSRIAAALVSKAPLPSPFAGRQVRPDGVVDWDAMNAHVLRRMIDRWLHPSSGDPFDLLVEAAGREYRASAVFRILLGRLAEREGYPAVTRYSLDAIARRLAPLQSGAEDLPGPVPPEVIAAGKRLEADLASLCRSLEEQARAAGKTAQSDSAVEGYARAAALKKVHPEPDLRAVIFEDPIHFELFMLDRSGRRGFAIWYQGPPAGPQGGQLRLEESEGNWKVEIFGSWIA